MSQEDITESMLNLLQHRKLNLFTELSETDLIKPKGLLGISSPTSKIMESRKTLLQNSNFNPNIDNDLEEELDDQQMIN